MRKRSTKTRVPPDRDKKRVAEARLRPVGARLGLLVAVLLGFAVLSFFAWSTLRPAPRVVRPPSLEQLDPVVVALIEAQAAEAEARPRAAEVHGTLGLVYEANLLWEEAEQSFETAARLAPEVMVWRLHQAVAMRQSGDAAGALNLLRVLADRHPSSAPVQQRLGDALLEAGDLPGANAAFRRLIALAPEEPHGYTGLGDVLLQQQEARQAERYLEKAVALAPRYRMAHYLLGMAYRRLGRMEDAERELAQGVEATVWYLADPLTDQVQQYAVNLTARLEQAQALLRAGQPQQAVALLEEVRLSYPADATVLNNLAIAYLRLGRLDDAEALLREALRHDAEKFSTYINLASWALRADRLQEALTYADTALMRAPTVDQVHFTRGQVLARLGRLKDALASLQQAQRLAPQTPQNHALSGDLCLRLEQYEEAFRHYQHALAIEAGFFPAQIGLARVHWALGRHQEARSALARARGLVPEHPMIARLEQQFEAGSQDE